MEKLIKNTITETYCLRHCRQDTPKRAVHAEGGAVSINTKAKSEDTEITDARNRRQPYIHTCRRPDNHTCFFLSFFLLFMCGDVAFSEYFLYHCRFLFVYGEYVVRSLVPDWCYSTL